MDLNIKMALSASVVLILFWFGSCVAQMNTLIDIGGETTKVAVYGEKEVPFRYLTSSNGKYFEPTVIAFTSSGEVLIGSNAQTREEHKGVSSIQYLFLYNGISKERSIANKRKRFNLVSRSGDNVRIIEQDPLQLQVGVITTSYGFVLSSFLNEIVDDIPLNDQNLQTDFPLVLGVPSFYNPNHINQILFAFSSLVKEDDNDVGIDVGDEEKNDDNFNENEKNQNEEELELKQNGVDNDPIENLENYLNNNDDDEMETLKDNNDLNLNDFLRSIKKSKKSKKKSKKATKDDTFNDLDDDEFQLNQQQNDGDNDNDDNTNEGIGDNDLDDDDDDSKHDNIKVIPNHLIHALSYFATQHNKENNPSNLPVVVLEFGASYFRGTKFQINGERTIKLLQHEVSFAINTRKINHALLVLLLNKKTDQQSVLNIIQSYTPSQTTRMWKEVDEIRVKLSASETLVTEFMEEKVQIDRSDLEGVLVNEINEINELLQKLSGDNSLVYLTGGLSYTPILRKQVENVFGTFSIRIGSEQLLEGMKLFGVLHPLNAMVTSAGKLPIIEDILPFGLYVEMDGFKEQLLERNHQFSGSNKEIVEFEPSEPQTISLCMEDVGGSEYDVDNCFQRYKVNGKVQVVVVPMNEGMIQQITAENGVSVVGEENQQEEGGDGVDITNEEEIERRIRRKVEYQKTLEHLKKQIRVLKKHPDLVDFIKSELKSIDNEVLYDVSEIDGKEREFFEYFNARIGDTNLDNANDVNDNQNDDLNGVEEEKGKDEIEEVDEKGIDEDYNNNPQQIPADEQNKPITKPNSQTTQELIEEAQKTIHTVISMFSNNPTLLEPLYVSIQDVERKIHGKTLKKEDIENLVLLAKELQRTTQNVSIHKPLSNYTFIFASIVAVIILFSIILFFIRSRPTFVPQELESIRER
ncbi:DNA double-strand break repair Rad50 ATPase [Entamoeba marina]